MLLGSLSILLLIGLQGCEEKRHQVSAGEEEPEQDGETSVASEDVEQSDDEDGEATEDENRREDGDPANKHSQRVARGRREREGVSRISLALVLQGFLLGLERVVLQDSTRLVEEQSLKRNECEEESDSSKDGDGRGDGVRGEVVGDRTGQHQRTKECAEDTPCHSDEEDVGEGSLVSEGREGDLAGCISSRLSGELGSDVVRHSWLFHVAKKWEVVAVTSTVTATTSHVNYSFQQSP
jgi:hypothetical protein